MHTPNSVHLSLSDYNSTALADYIKEHNFRSHHIGHFRTTNVDCFV